MLVDIFSAGVNFTGIDGLIGSSWEGGFYYNSDTGEFGIYYSSGGGINLVNDGIIAGFELSISMLGTWAPTEEAFFGDAQATSGITIPLTPTGVGLTTSASVSQSGTALSSGLSVGGGMSTVSRSTRKIVLH